MTQVETGARVYAIRDAIVAKRPSRQDRMTALVALNDVLAALAAAERRVAEL